MDPKQLHKSNSFGGGTTTWGHRKNNYFDLICHWGEEQKGKWEFY